MSEKVLARFKPSCVEFPSARVWEDNAFWEVPIADGEKATEAMRATPPREIEIVSVDGVRTVRLVPSVVVKARGTVDRVCVNGEIVVDTKPNGNGPRYVPHFDVSNPRDASLAMHDHAEVEVVSVDGGPDMVRRVS